MKMSSNFLETLKGFDISNLDKDEIGIWPLPVKIMMGVILFCVVLFIAYQVNLRQMGNAVSSLEKDERLQIETLTEKSFHAANVGLYKQQMSEIQGTFTNLVKRLPSDIEVPGLLEDITHTALSSGLELDGITLLNEETKDYYIELPIKIEAEGGYHEVALFISGISALPRIVTVHDIIIEPIKDSKELKAVIIAKTYRYNDAVENNGENDNEK